MKTPKVPCAATILNPKTGDRQPCAQYGRYTTSVDGTEHVDGTRFCHAHSLMGRIHRNQRREKRVKETNARLAELIEVRRREERSFALLKNIPDEVLYSDRMERAINVAKKMLESGSL
jgi:hypothetical protein